MKKKLWRIFGFVFAAFVLYQKHDAMISIVAVLAYAAGFSLMLSPLCSKMEKHGIGVSWAALISVGTLLLAVFLLLAALIPYLVVQSVYLFRRISPVSADLLQMMRNWLDEAGFLRMMLSGSDDLLRIPLAEITGTLAKAGMIAVEQLGRIGFALVLTYYILCERNRISRHLLLFLPILWRKPVWDGIQVCRNAIMSYFSGLLKTSVFVSAATCAGLVLLGIQDALLLSLFMGIMEILPYLGPIIASIPILLSALAQGGEKFLPVAGMLILVQQIEGNFISPHFTASSTSIHPLAAILGVYVTGNLLGIWGILLALPLMVLAQSVLLSYRQARTVINDLDEE